MFADWKWIASERRLGWIPSFKNQPNKDTHNQKFVQVMLFFCWLYRIHETRKKLNTYLYICFIAAFLFLFTYFTELVTFFFHFRLFTKVRKCLNLLSYYIFISFGEIAFCLAPFSNTPQSPLLHLHSHAQTSMTIFFLKEELRVRCMHLQVEKEKWNNVLK